MTKADLQAGDPETVELNFMCGGKEKLKAVYRLLSSYLQWFTSQYKP